MSPSNYIGVRNGLLDAKGEVLGGWSAARKQLPTYDLCPSTPPTLRVGSVPT